MVENNDKVCHQYHKIIFIVKNKFNIVNKLFLGWSYLISQQYLDGCARIVRQEVIGRGGLVQRDGVGDQRP